MDPRGIRTPAATPPPGVGTKEIPAVQLSGETQVNNASKLYEYFNEDHRIRNIFAEGWGGGYTVPSTLRPEPAKRLINFMVANNPIFQNNKIVEYLGGGSFGFVVLLDNNHALKIFVGSYDPGSGRIDPTGGLDIKRYKASQEKAFGGTSEPGELMIYDEGEIETPLGRKWFYAEMPQLRTLSDYMRYVHKDKDAQKVTEGVDYEISFLKELAYISNLVDAHGAEAVIEDAESPAQAQAWEDLWNADPEALAAKLKDKSRKKPIINMMKCCMAIDTKPRGDEPTQLAEFAELLGQGNLDAIFNTTGYKNRKKLFLLDKTYAKNLFNQLKEILKTKILDDITDIRGANVGISQQDESLPIIFDY